MALHFQSDEGHIRLVRGTVAELLSALLSKEAVDAFPEATED